MKPLPQSFEERAAEKQGAREADQRALDAGQKSRDDLRRENGYFAFPKAKLRLDKSKLS